MTSLANWSPEALLDAAASIRILVSDAAENLDVPSEELDTLAQELVAMAFTRFAEEARNRESRTLEYVHRTPMGGTKRFICAYDLLTDLIWCVEDGGVVVLPVIPSEAVVRNAGADMIELVVYDTKGQLYATGLVHANSRRIFRLTYKRPRGS